MDQKYSNYLESFNSLDVDEKREHLLLLLKDVFDEASDINNKLGINSDVYIYDPVENDNVKFEDLNEDWVCPLCGVAKDQFEKVL